MQNSLIVQSWLVKDFGKILVGVQIVWFSFTSHQTGFHFHVVIAWLFWSRWLFCGRTPERKIYINISTVSKTVDFMTAAKKVNKCKYEVGTLTHWFPIHPFFIPWKHQKTFLMFLGGRERVHWGLMGYCPSFQTMSVSSKRCNKHFLKNLSEYLVQGQWRNSLERRDFLVYFPKILNDQ